MRRLPGRLVVERMFARYTEFGAKIRHFDSQNGDFAVFNSVETSQANDTSAAGKEIFSGWFCRMRIAGEVYFFETKGFPLM